MSVNSKAKRDRKKKSKSGQKNFVKVQRSASDRHLLMMEFQRLFSNLTTPKHITSRVLSFCKTISESKPFFIDSEPELWSRQSCCDSNVIEYIKHNGGEMVCGYRIWFHDPNYIEAERHAIWKNGDALRDVSFPSSGEVKTVFLPDDPDSESLLDDRPPKFRFAFAPNDKRVLAAYEEIEARIPMEQMSREESWREMLTYEDWLAGKRMGNFIPVVKTTVRQDTPMLGST